MASISARAALAGLILAGLCQGPAAAQRPGAQVGRFEVPGFDFRPDGAWRKRTRPVMARRSSLLMSGAVAALNSRAAGNQVTGNFNLPVILVEFKNRAGAFTEPAYQDVLFSPAPATNPYSVKTFYEQLSNGLITMNGVVKGWITADSNDTYYEDGCNAISISSACAHPLSNGISSRFRDLLLEVLGKVDDGTFDWGQFDNDGPDGVPNSGDDDGFVDFVTFVHADIDGACGSNPHIWAHRFSISGLNAGSNYVTKTARTGGGFIQVRDYTIQSGLGGNLTSCNGLLIMPVGTVAHETGHAFGLPDLYDTNPSQSAGTEGIGEWGLMGSGNYARPYSPSRMEAWSLTQLGWVNVDTLTASQTVALYPIQSSDTVLYVGTPVAGEYFLLENRDSLEADTAQMNAAFGSRKKNPGLLIWHIDQSRINAGLFNNSVNQGTIQGVALMQADGLNQLRTPGGGNRGDAGDSYPGSTVNRAFTFSTNPGSVTNQNQYTGFGIDSIYRNNMGTGVPSPVVFRFLKRERSVFAGTRSGSSVKVNGVSTVRFDDVVAPGANVDLDVVSPSWPRAAGPSSLSWPGATAGPRPIRSSRMPPSPIPYWPTSPPITRSIWSRRPTAGA